MEDITGQALTELAKHVPAEVVKSVYEDGAQRLVQQVGLLGEDFAKTVRLALFPLQFTAMAQDRLQKYIKNAFDKVPKERVIPPVESIFLEVSERLRYQEENSIISKMYVDLLSCTIDKDKVKKAHPAFVYLIAQLSPDEAKLIKFIAEKKLVTYVKDKNQNIAILDDDARSWIQMTFMGRRPMTEILGMLIPSSNLSFPELLYTYIQHIDSLNIIEYVNGTVYSQEAPVPPQSKNANFYLRLTGIGTLFFEACCQHID